MTSTSFGSLTISARSPGARALFLMLPLLAWACSSPNRAGGRSDTGVTPARPDAAADLKVDVAIDGPGKAEDVAASDVAPGEVDALVCPPGKKVCFTACIDVGAPCENACPAGQNPCGTGEDPSTKLCTDAKSLMACGAACTRCPTDPNGTASCDGDKCELTCQTVFHRCGDACVDSNAITSCGTACTPCVAPTGGTATCDGTRCGGACPAETKLCAGACIPVNQACAGTCPAGKHDCAGNCVADNDVNNCGTACSPCAPPSGAEATCNGTTCGFKCRAGFHLCGQECKSDSSVDSCGTGPNACTRCPAPAGGTATCNGTSCGFRCDSGRKCGDQCIGDDVPCAGACGSGRTLCNGACIPSNQCCADKDCPRCQECAAGACRAQSAGQDKKSECGGRGCNAGVCRVCNPSEAQSCMDNVIKKCSADGSGYAQVDGCGGKGCTSSGCKVCTANQGECNGNVFRKCNGSGTGYGAPQTCGLGCTTDGCTVCTTPITCYRDSDKDGFGDAGDSKQGCGTCESGYVTNKTDCYDANAMAFPRGPTTGFDDFFPDHRGDGSFDYSCDGRVETSPSDPEKAVCMGVGATCEIVRKDFAPSICGTLVPVITCSCNDLGMGCNKSCRPIGAPGSRIQVKCR